jgi:hypothetical protein
MYFLIFPTLNTSIKHEAETCPTPTPQMWSHSNEPKTMLDDWNFVSFLKYIYVMLL